MSLITSPYDGLPVEKWKDKTHELVTEHPLDNAELVQIVTESWFGILNTRIGAGDHQIGVDVFPSPQIMAFLLHELIPLELGRLYPGVWRRDNSLAEKDVVYILDDNYSFEIKASSRRNSIFANRSYAQPSSTSKKHKAGYYLAVNFEKFNQNNTSPSITRIRMGWLDHTDWIGQRAPTGQQARLDISARDNKFVDLYPVSE